MLRDEMIDRGDVRYERPSNLETQYGSCRFCGQMARIETLIPWTIKDLNECATELCTCSAAANYTSRKRRKEEGSAKILKMFGEAAGEMKQSEEIQQLLNDSLALVAEEEIKKITINIDGIVKADITLTGKGNIKVNRTVTRRESSEV